MNPDRDIVQEVLATRPLFPRHLWEGALEITVEVHRTRILLSAVEIEPNVWLVTADRLGKLRATASLTFSTEQEATAYVEEMVKKYG